MTHEPDETRLTLLVIEDNPGDVVLLRTMVERENRRVEVTSVETLDGGLSWLRDHHTDLVLCDLMLADSSGLETFLQLNRAHPDVPKIVLSGLDDEALAICAVKSGAQDYLVKGRIQGAELMRSVRYAIERRRINAALQESKQQLAASQQALQQLSAHLIDVREKEQQRIARDLHDDLGQMLTVLKMDAAWLLKLIDESQEPARRHVASMLMHIDLLMARVSELVSQLRPGMLDALGLAATVEWLVSRFDEFNDLTCRLSIVPLDLTADEPASTAIFRILQEALTNIARHAQASSVRVELGLDDGYVVLEVCDDGVGFTAPESARPGSWGLVGVRERVRALDGTAHIESAPGRGTCIRVRVPAHRGA